VSAFESEVTESAEFDAVSDEIRRWSSLQKANASALSVPRMVYMMWQLRILFPLHFVVFKQTACHLAAEANVEQVFSRAGQLSEVNLDPDALADMVSIMVNKLAHKPSVRDIMDKYYSVRCSEARTQQTKKTFSTVPTTTPIFNNLYSDAHLQQLVQRPWPPNRVSERPLPLG
jgi:hypothetical protein